MTDQADTPDPIGGWLAVIERYYGTDSLAASVYQRATLHTVARDLAEGVGVGNAAAAKLATLLAESVAEVRALRAENGDLRRQLLNEKQAFAPMHMRVERERLCAELAAARDRDAALRSALERTQTNFIDAVRGNPVCGMAENLAENTAALGASVQSEQPTKGASE